uniref:BPTI/Kunitz inhibitor domain-containing protein n=1 Tax=Xiphophorus couchianus TaxID=32473 RepID=A0A3B5N0R1_9TELE
TGSGTLMIMTVLKIKLSLNLSFCHSTEFCNLPSDPGEGTTFTFFVYYKHEEDKCLPFFYQGQGGNANRFKSERDCNRTCVGIHGELITISSYLFVAAFSNSHHLCGSAFHCHFCCLVNCDSPCGEVKVSLLFVLLFHILVLFLMD